MTKHAAKSKGRVLSVRVSEAEWELLQNTLRKNAVDVSTLLRQGLHNVLKPTG